jgi:hypothetical protein
MNRYLSNQRRTNVEESRPLQHFYRGKELEGLVRHFSERSLLNAKILWMYS